MLTRVTDKALQIHGGIGFWQPNAIERVYRDARAQRFEEGTNEIQKTVIARALLGSTRRRRMSRRFENKVSLITGSSRGIGRALALTLAREGASSSSTTFAMPTLGCRPFARSKRWARGDRGSSEHGDGGRDRPPF